MADTSNIKLSPEQMEMKAQQFMERNEEFTTVVNTMGQMVEELCSDWAGKSSQAFYDQFNGLKPSFEATKELIQSISQQLRDVSQIMQNVDLEISQKMGVK
jgi:WXG100 family type VII secretion target